jgi:RimJ/RimL family protein N-acetyltransferase
VTEVQDFLGEIIAGRRSVEVELRAPSGPAIGKMVPVTRAHLDDAFVIGKLTDWRNQHMERFLTQFVATPERTRNWLHDVVLAQPGQMMFLVYSGDQLVGHYGFKNLTRDDVMLDNAMRGERGGHPALLQVAGRALNEWLFAHARVQTIYGYVLADNASAIMMNRQLGFGGWAKHPMAREVVGGETRWTIGSEGAHSPDGAYCYRIVMSRPANA